ncbi:MAG TPA: hypothetical protein VK939_01645 [Longimicrobiales bacterium]|nr:hypothetical protein [Longimicrobiales bacterium]
MHRVPARALLLPLLLLSAACYRSVAVGSETDATYSVLVENQTGRAMVVSYTDASGTGVLGTVRMGDSERFILARVSGPEITVSARSDDGTRVAGPYRVTLSPGRTPRVLLR